MFWRVILFFSHSLLFLQPSSAVAFCCHFSWCHKVVVRIWRGFDANSTTPPWNIYIPKFDPGWEDHPVWQTGQPPGGSSHMWCKRDQIAIWEITWKGGLPQLLGVLHFHVNRPYEVKLLIWLFTEDVSIKQRKTSQLQENLPTFNKLNKGKEINKVWITHIVFSDVFAFRRGSGFLRANVSNFRESVDSREFLNFFIFCPKNLYSTLILKITLNLSTAF